MSSLAASIRARDGRTRTSTDEHGQTGEGVWYFARPSAQTHPPVYETAVNVTKPFFPCPLDATDVRCVWTYSSGAIIATTVVVEEGQV